MNTIEEQETCIWLNAILALLETDNTKKAIEVIQNAIHRIEHSMSNL